MPVRRMNGLSRFAALTIALVGAVSCEIAETVAPAIEPRAVVHSVLNPAVTQQLVIVERTLRSRTQPSETPRREPIADARVVIYGPREDSVIAVQTPGASDGLYRFQSVTVTNGSAGQGGPNVLRIRPGERYRLKVETSLGVTTGETTIPVAGGVDEVRRLFNVDRDTLQLTVPVSSAAGYMLRLESRRGCFLIPSSPFECSVSERFMTSFGDALVLPLALEDGDPDDKDWGFEFAQHIMFPGFDQRFIVVAVDSNYFRYNAAGFDPFGDDTPGNSLTGGVGMFGAVATVMIKTMDLTADLDTPIEGTWTADRNSATLPLTITLYSSPYFPGVGLGSTPVLTGSASTPAGRALDASGSLNGAGVSLQFSDPTPGGQPANTVNATGLLSAGVLELTDARTRERLTYRKR